MQKKIILFLFVFLTSAVFISKVSAQTPVFDPGKEIVKNIPFQMSGVNCGIPNSPADACCSSSLSFHVNKKDLDNLISDLTDGNHKNLDKSLTPAERDLLENLILVNEDDFNIFAQLAGFLNKLNSGGQLSDFEKAQLIKLLTQSAQKLNSLKGGDLLKLQIRKTYVGQEDTCIIDAKVVHGFCIRGMSEFFAGIIGNNPNFQKFFEFAQNSPTEKCVFGAPVTKGSSCVCEASQAAQLCNDYLSDTKEYGSCANCMVNKNGIWTGVGCVRTGNTGEFIQDILLTWGMGLAGLIAFICIIYSAFLLQTSQGSPERIKKAREYLTNCIIGLVLIIFSIFILRLIGVNILQIPGFWG